ncbi:hypothetical protein F4824DRAFT_494907 [Ustulina deusta]|nr:hypothetical protein F4824DRAFT_494907 [Ustulina deusta]
MKSWERVDMPNGKPIFVQDQRSDSLSSSEMESTGHQGWTLVHPVEPTKPRRLQLIKQVPLSRGRIRYAPVRNEERIIEERKKLIAEGLGDQQLKSSHQQIPLMTIKAPIVDLKSLAYLNEYRRRIGLELGIALGPSLNLMSSAVYNYDPITTKAFYEKLDRSAPGDFRTKSMQGIREEYGQDVGKVVANYPGAFRHSHRYPSYSGDPFLARARDLPFEIFWSRQSRFFPKDGDGNSSSHLPSQPQSSNNGSNDDQLSTSHQTDDGNRANTYLRRVEATDQQHRSRGVVARGAWRG